MIKARSKYVKVTDIDQLIESKLLELIGDPDSGLKLKKSFKAKLEQRLYRPSKKIPHDQVVRRFA